MNLNDQASIDFIKERDFKRAFKYDLFNRLDTMTDGFEKNLPHYEVENLAVSYTIEKCKEFKARKGYMSIVVIEFMCDEVWEVLEEMASTYLGYSDELKRRVKEHLE